MNSANIIGIGAVPIGKHSTVLEHELLASAFLEAVKDSGIQKGDIDSLIFSSPRQYARQRYFGTFFAAYMGIELDGLLCEVVGNGMTGGLAFDVAVQQVSTGGSDIAIALGVSIETMVSAAEHMEWDMRAVGDVDFHSPLGVTPISWYAMGANRYMHDFGYSSTDLAHIAVKNRHHASMNPLAQFTSPITTDDVAKSRPIVKPLRLLDVPARSDGAVAIVLASDRAARKFAGKPIRILGRGFHHEGIHQLGSDPTRPLTSYVAAERAAQTAYAEAGLGPDSVDVADVYAPCSIVEVILSEALGFFSAGDGLAGAIRGDTSLGGRIPISTSGGLLSRGHPPLVTPLYCVYEVVQQLRGDARDRQVGGAQVGMTTAELGHYNSALIHLFGV